MLHFPFGLDDDYYRQLTAEKIVTRYNKDGFPQRVWVLPSGRRNEALDVEVYALAAAVRAGLNRVNWDDLQHAINLKKNSNPNQPASETSRPHIPRPRRVKSKYMNRRI